MSTKFKYELRSVILSPDKTIESTKHIKFQWFNYNNKPETEVIKPKLDGTHYVWYRTGEMKND